MESLNKENKNIRKKKQTVCQGKRSKQAKNKRAAEMCGQSGDNA